MHEVVEKSTDQKSAQLSLFVLADTYRDLKFQQMVKIVDW